MEQVQDSIATEELPRSEPKILTDRLRLILEDIHARLNGESKECTLPVVLSFSGEVPRLPREERKNIVAYLQQKNPVVFDYLQRQGIEFVQLGDTSGKIVVNSTVKQLDDLQTYVGLREIDSALNEFETYLKIFKTKQF